MFVAHVYTHVYTHLPAGPDSSCECHRRLARDCQRGDRVGERFEPVIDPEVGVSRGRPVAIGMVCGLMVPCPFTDGTVLAQGLQRVRWGKASQTVALIRNADVELYGIRYMFIDG